MDASPTRRVFLGGSAAAGLGFLLAGSGSLDTFARPIGGSTARGYGALLADPQRILALPRGFSYRIVARSGQTPTTDGVHPSDPDGMGIFGGSNGGSILIVNHENNGQETNLSPVPAVAGVTYDPGAPVAPPRSSSTGSVTVSRSTRVWPAPTTTAPAAPLRGGPG